MAIQTTVIPANIDSTAVDGVTMGVNTNSKLQVNNELLREIAQNMLNIQILAVENTSALVDTDDYAEYYSDSNGLNNTVDTGNTTSSFNASKYYERTGTNTNRFSSTSGVVQTNYNYVNNTLLANSFTPDTTSSEYKRVQIDISSVTGSPSFDFHICSDNSGEPNYSNKIASKTGVSLSGGGLFDITFDSTFSLTGSTKYWLVATSSTSSTNYPLVDDDDSHTNGDFIISTDSGSTWGSLNTQGHLNMTVATFTESDTEIHHNLSSLSGTPTSCYVVAFDDSGKRTNLGTLSFKLNDGSSDTSEYNLEEVVTWSGLSGVPTVLKLLQKSPGSKVSRVIALFQ